MNDLSRACVADLAAGFVDGSVSPVEATRAALDAIAMYDGDVNAFVLVTDWDADVAFYKHTAGERQPAPADGPKAP